MKKKPGAMANAFLFSTGLAPLITEMLFRYPGEAWHGFTGLGIVLALAVGVFIGFLSLPSCRTARRCTRATTFITQPCPSA